MSHPVPAVVVALAGLAIPPAPAAGRDVDFSRDVLPILTANCFPCHGPDAAARKADLRLDVRDGAVAADGSGVIVPGRPGRSELVARLTTPEAARRMPPAKSG